MHFVRVLGAAILAAAASAGCASRGRLRESPDPGLRRGYAASPAATYRALHDALRELGFPIRAEDPVALSLTVGVDWKPVAARGRFEADLPSLAPADLRCRIESGSVEECALIAAVRGPHGGAVGHEGDVLMIVFNRTQDLLAGGKHRTPNDK